MGNFISNYVRLCNSVIDLLFKLRNNCLLATLGSKILNILNNACMIHGKNKLLAKNVNFAYLQY